MTIRIVGKKKGCCLTKEQVEELHQLERIFGVVDLKNWTFTEGHSNKTNKKREI